MDTFIQAFGSLDLIISKQKEEQEQEYQDLEMYRQNEAKWHAAMWGVSYTSIVRYRQTEIQDQAYDNFGLSYDTFGVMTVEKTLELKCALRRLNKSWKIEISLGPIPLWGMVRIWIYRILHDYVSVRIMVANENIPWETCVHATTVLINQCFTHLRRHFDGNNSDASTWVHQMEQYTQDTVFKPRLLSILTATLNNTSITALMRFIAEEPENIQTHAHAHLPSNVKLNQKKDIARLFYNFCLDCVTGIQHMEHNIITADTDLSQYLFSGFIQTFTNNAMKSILPQSADTGDRNVPLQMMVQLKRQDSQDENNVYGDQNNNNSVPNLPPTPKPNNKKKRAATQSENSDFTVPDVDFDTKKKKQKRQKRQ